jgi:predicted ATPase
MATAQIPFTNDEDRLKTFVADRAKNVVDVDAESGVVLDHGPREVRFRLLETTRAYAQAKLTENDEADDLGRRNATYYRDLSLRIH